MDEKMDLIISMMKELSQKTDGNTEAIKNLESYTKKELTEKVSSIDGDLQALTSKVVDLESYTKKELTEKVSSIDGDLHSLAGTVTRLEIYVMEKVPAALDGWKAHLETQEEIKEDVTILKEKVENHSIRISALEDALEA